MDFRKMDRFTWNMVYCIIERRKKLLSENLTNLIYSQYINRIGPSQSHYPRNFFALRHSYRPVNRHRNHPARSSESTSKLRPPFKTGKFIHLAVSSSQADSCHERTCLTIITANERGGGGRERVWTGSSGNEAASSLPGETTRLAKLKR